MWVRIPPSKKCKKPLDKPNKMCYNKHVIKGKENPLKNQKGTDTMATKMTNKNALTYVLDTFGADLPADVAEKLNGMIAQLDKKSGAERKPTARQVENAKVKEDILSKMEDNVLYTVGDMLKTFALGEDMTSQRLTAILSQMVEAQTVTKTKEKGKSLFSKAD